MTFSMGGYGLYVWSAYAITLMIFGINLFLAFFEKKQVRKKVQKHFKIKNCNGFDTL